MASVMPHGAGEDTFQSRLNQNEPFEQVQLVALVQAIAEELGRAHRAGRYHGAITPVDIRFDAMGRVHLGGWGRDTTPGTMPTSAYAAVECYAPVHPQGPWTDVYALAAILWRAVTGGPPTTALNRTGNVTLSKIAPSRFDPAFLKAIDAALDVAPQRRPPDIDSWLALLAGQPVPAAKTTPVAPPIAAAATSAATIPPPAPRPKFALGSLAVGAGAVAAIAGGIYLATPADPQPWAAQPSTRPAVVEPRRPREVAAAVPTPVIAEAPPVEVAAVQPEPIPVQTVTKPTVSAPVEVVRAVEPVRSKPVTSPAAAPSAPAPGQAAPAPRAEPPLELLARADDYLRDVYGDFDRLSRRMQRSYGDEDMPYATKQQAYRESRRIQAELVELREDRNRIARADSVDVANRRYAELAEDVTRVRDRIEMVRRSL